jgi:anthranilate phosphoribosyltransferase
VQAAPARYRGHPFAVQEFARVIHETIGRIANGQDLTQEEMATAIDEVMRGQCRPQEIALLLTGLAMKGETVEEIAGAATAMRRHMTPIHSQRPNLLDTCGTGGDGSGTFNISTATAIVAAAAGVAVAKHGNRRATSRSGSADVLMALGVNVEIEVSKVEQCLDELGICFCFAPLLHQSMRHVAEVRRQLEMPTIFNLLGPLTNPAGAPYQLLGVGHDDRRPQLAQALALLGTRRALVVCGADGLDEVTLAAETRVTEVSEAKTREFEWTPQAFGLERSGLAPLSVSGPAESAEMIRAVLAGEPGPARDIVVINAAAALIAVERVSDARQAAEQAAAAIDSGAARDVLRRLVEMTNA